MPRQPCLTTHFRTMIELYFLVSVFIESFIESFIHSFLCLIDAHSEPATGTNFRKYTAMSKVPKDPQGAFHYNEIHSIGGRIEDVN